MQYLIYRKNTFSFFIMFFTAAAPVLNICRWQSATAFIGRVFSQHSELCRVPGVQFERNVWPKLWFLPRPRWLWHEAEDPLRRSPQCSPGSEQPSLSAEPDGRVVKVKVAVQNILIAEFQCGFLYYLFLFYSGYVTLSLVVLDTLLWTAVKRQILTILSFLHAYYFEMLRTS